MLSPQEQQQSAQIRVARDRSAVNQHLVSTQRHAHRANHHHNRSGVLARKGDEVRSRHTQFENVDFTQAVKYVLVADLILAALGVDLLLYRPVVLFFTGADLYGWLKWVVMLAFAAFIILTERGISSVRHHHGERYTHHLEGAGQFLLWCLFSVLMNAVIPLGVVASFLAAYNNLVPVVRYPVLLSLAILAVIAHGAVIWTGQVADDAIGFIIFSVHLGWLEWRVYRHHRRQNGAEQATRDAFITYTDGRDLFNARNNGNLPIGPPLLDAVTIEVLRRIFGRPLIQMPEGGGGTPPSLAAPPDTPPSPASSVPSPISGGNGGRPADQAHAIPEETSDSHVSVASGADVGNGELDYLRTILSRRVREADGEVKP